MPLRRFLFLIGLVTGAAALTVATGVLFGLKTAAPGALVLPLILAGVARLGFR
jgi:hypothetical protein